MNSLPFAIKEMTKLDQPREKISRLGATSLSDVELLALIIGSGNKNQQVHKIAYNLLNLFDKNELEVSISKLSTIKGIGKMRSSQIEAAFEFCRRRFHPSTMSIRKPEDALPLFLPYVTRKQEHFLCTSLNGAYEVIKTRVVSIGLLNKTMVHPREVFSDPLMDRAAAVIVGHNHPSGDLTPSTEDIEMTCRLKNCSELLGISLLDHLIISEYGYYSFLNDKKL